MWIFIFSFVIEIFLFQFNVSILRELKQEHALKMIFDQAKKKFNYFHNLNLKLLPVLIHLMGKICNCGQIMLRLST